MLELSRNQNPRALAEAMLEGKESAHYLLNESPFHSLARRLENGGSEYTSIKASLYSEPDYDNRITMCINAYDYRETLVSRFVVHIKEDGSCYRSNPAVAENTTVPESEFKNFDRQQTIKVLEEMQEKGIRESSA